MTNLLYKASIVTTPTSYGVGVLNSIKPASGNADFDFTRTSSATRVNPDYLIETVSINSANLVQNGNFSELGAEAITNGNFANGSTGWSLNAPPWSIVNAKAVADGTSNNPIFQDGVITGGKQYSVTYTLSNFTQGSVYVDLGSGGIGATRTISGTYTEIILAAGNNTRFYLRGSGNFIVSLDNVSVKQVDPNDNWLLQNGSIINEGVAKVVANGFLSSSGSNWSLYQTDVFETNAKYKVTFKAKQTSGTGEFLLGAGYGQPFTQVITSEFVNYSVDITAIVVNGNLTIGGGTVGDTFEITDISVIEITQVQYI